MNFDYIKRKKHYKLKLLTLVLVIIALILDLAVFIPGITGSICRHWDILLTASICLYIIIISLILYTNAQ